MTYIHYSIAGKYAWTLTAEEMLRYNWLITANEWMRTCGVGLQSKLVVRTQMRPYTEPELHEEREPLDVLVEILPGRQEIQTTIHPPGSCPVVTRDKELYAALRDLSTQSQRPPWKAPDPVAYCNMPKSLRRFKFDKTAVLHVVHAANQFGESLVQATIRTTGTMRRTGEAVYIDHQFTQASDVTVRSTYITADTILREHLPADVLQDLLASDSWYEICRCVNVKLFAKTPRLLRNALNALFHNTVKHHHDGTWTVGPFSRVVSVLDLVEDHLVELAGATGAAAINKVLEARK